MEVAAAIRVIAHEYVVLHLRFHPHLVDVSALKRTVELEMPILVVVRANRLSWFPRLLPKLNKLVDLGLVKDQVLLMFLLINNLLVLRPPNLVIVHVLRVQTTQLIVLSRIFLRL